MIGSPIAHSRSPLIHRLFAEQHDIALRYEKREVLPNGVAQALAPVPGVSRSGITITAALLLNMSRKDAARFSFLLSIPVISGAGAIKAWELIQSAVPVNWLLIGCASLVSAITAYACIALFLRLLDRIGMMPFVYYRILLALILFAVWLA